MKASFLPTTTYSIKAVYEAGWPSPPALFEPEAGQRMMAEMLEQAECAEEVGFDWISFSEHHYAPLLLPTPNPALFAAAASQHLRRVKIALFGPVLPLHNPIHVAEEVAMLDVLSGGRLLLLFLRGVPYELRAFSVNLEETRAMTQEATRLISRALTDPQPFSWEGKYYHYQTVSVWPGLSQRHGLAMSFAPASYVARIVAHYKAEAARHGWEPREDQIVYRGNIIATDSDEEAQQLAARLATLPHLRRSGGAPVSSTAPAGQENKAATSISDLATAQFCGSPQTLVQQLRKLHDLGVGAVDLVIPTNLMTQQQVLRALELLGKEVIPHMHAF